MQILRKISVFCFFWSFMIGWIRNYFLLRYMQLKRFIKKIFIFFWACTIGITLTIIASASYDASINERAIMLTNALKWNAEWLSPEDRSLYYVLVHENIKTLISVLTQVDLLLGDDYKNNAPSDGTGTPGTGTPGTGTPGTGTPGTGTPGTGTPGTGTPGTGTPGTGTPGTGTPGTGTPGTGTPGTGTPTLNINIYGMPYGGNSGWYTAIRWEKYDGYYEVVTDGSFTRAQCTLWYSTNQAMDGWLTYQFVTDSGGRWSPSTKIKDNFVFDTNEMKSRDITKSKLTAKCSGEVNGKWISPQLEKEFVINIENPALPTSKSISFGLASGSAYSVPPGEKKTFNWSIAQDSASQVTAFKSCEIRQYTASTGFTTKSILDISKMRSGTYTSDIITTPTSYGIFCFEDPKDPKTQTFRLTEIKYGTPNLDITLNANKTTAKVGEKITVSWSLPPDTAHTACVGYRVLSKWGYSTINWNSHVYNELNGLTAKSGTFDILIDPSDIQSVKVWLSCNGSIPDKQKEIVIDIGGASTTPGAPTPIVTQCSGWSETRTSPDSSQSCDFSWNPANPWENGVVTKKTNGGILDGKCGANGVWERWNISCPNKTTVTCVGWWRTFSSQDGSNSCTIGYNSANMWQTLTLGNWVTDASGIATKADAVCGAGGVWSYAVLCPNKVGKSCPQWSLTIPSTKNGSTATCTFNYSGAAVWTSKTINPNADESITAVCKDVWWTQGEWEVQWAIVCTK